MKAAQVDAVERTTALLTRFSLSTAAPELGQRLESAGHREALLLVLEVLEMEAEAREQRKITRLRRCPAAGRCRWRGCGWPDRRGPAPRRRSSADQLIARAGVG